MPSLCSAKFSRGTLSSPRVQYMIVCLSQQMKIQSCSCVGEAYSAQQARGLPAESFVMRKKFLIGYGSNYENLRADCLLRNIQG